VVRHPAVALWYPRVTSLFDEFTSSATFSPCRRYRYTLTRTWAPDNLTINFVMLNPSTADEVSNDPTVERCERRARMWNYGTLIVTNIFAWRSTDPAALREVPDPVGPGNDEAIVRASQEAQLVVCGWGKDGALLGRGAAVRRILLMGIVIPHYLRLSEKTGQPWHPLYLPELSIMIRRKEAGSAPGG
jgi:hypothetical protein